MVICLPLIFTVQHCGVRNFEIEGLYQAHVNFVKHFAIHFNIQRADFCYVHVR